MIDYFLGSNSKQLLKAIILFEPKSTRKAPRPKNRKIGT
jgi:hypothetical protein